MKKMAAPDSVSVSREDQERINTFSCLNQKHQVLQAEINELTEELKRINDATEEVLITMHADDILLQFGECFIPSTDEEVSESLEKDRAAKEKKLEDRKKRADELSEEMSALKHKLYATFGNTINLEA